MSSNSINNTSSPNLLQMRMEALRQEAGSSAGTGGAKGTDGAGTVAGQGAGAAGPTPDALAGKTSSAVSAALNAVFGGDKEKRAGVKNGDAALERMNAALAELRKGNDTSIDAGGMSGGSVMQSLARVMIEMQANQRTAALQSRNLAYNQAQAHSMNQAEKMKGAADDMEDGANKAIIINSVIGAVSLGMSIGSTAAQGVQVGKMARAGTESAFQVASKGADLAGGFGQIAQTAGGIGSSQAGAQDTKAQADAKRKEAEGSEEAAQATAAQQRADMAKDVQGQMEEMVKKIIEFVRELQDAEVESMRAITRG